MPRLDTMTNWINRKTGRSYTLGDIVGDSHRMIPVDPEDEVTRVKIKDFHKQYLESEDSQKKAIGYSKDETLCH